MKANYLFVLAGAELGSALPLFSLPFSLPTLGGLGALSGLPQFTGLDILTALPQLTGLGLPQFTGLGDFTGFPQLTALGELSAFPQFTGFPQLTGLGELSALPQFTGLGSSPTLGGLTASPVLTAVPTTLATSLAIREAALVTPTTIATLTSAVSATEATAACAAQSTDGGFTENGVTDNNCCTDVTVIFARGTFEPGNVGIFAGPAMFTSLRKALPGQVTVQGVDYSADVAGDIALGATGGPTMASLVKQARSQCPSTKVVLSGYSEGAMVVHNAFSQGLTSEDVTAIVMFGDPLHIATISQVSSDKVKEFCAVGDILCEGTGLIVITATHLSYSGNADEAASFIVNATAV